MSSSLTGSRGAAPKRRTWFSGFSLKLGIKFFGAVLDTAGTLSIVARRLLKTFRKTKTVAIKVGDGCTIHSLGGGSM